MKYLNVNMCILEICMVTSYVTIDVLVVRPGSDLRLNKDTLREEHVGGFQPFQS